MANVLGVGGVVYTEANLILALRDRVGQVATTILTDAQCKTFLEDARVELNRKKPLRQLKSFATQANVQRYSKTDLGLPAEWLGEPVGFWDGGAAAGCASLGLFGTFGDPWNWILRDLFQNGGKLVQVNAAAIDRMFREISFLYDRFGGKALWGTDEYMWLDPTPTEAGTSVYYLVEVPRFATTVLVDERFREAFLSWAEARACWYMAQRQGEIGQWESNAGKKGSNAKGERYERQALRAEDRFHFLTVTPGGVSVLRQR